MHASNEEEHIGKEQQRSPNEYQANERFNHRLMQCVPNVILFLSPDHQILEFNPEAERLYGRKREDVLGKDYFEEFLPDDAREAVTADIEKVLAGEPTKGFDNVVIAHDGQEHLLSWNVDRVLDSENKPIGIVAVGQDTTEREKAEETLQKSEDKYRTLFESANDVIFTLEVNENSLCFKECNSRVIDMFRCRREDIIGKSPVDFSPSFQPDGTLSTERAAQLCAAAVAGEPQHFEWKHCRLDGTEFDAEVTLNRVDIAGEAYLQAIVRDITERKEAEEALRGQRDRAQNYLNVAGVMFAHIDTEGKVTLINEKGCDILGYQEEEIVGKNWFDNFLPERNREAVKEVFFKLIAGKIELVEYYENPILTKDGEERIIAWHNTILREEGKIIGTLSSGEDITERKKAEEALQESENRYRSVVENAGEGIVISQDGILKFINPHFIDITGYSEEEFKSRPFIEFVHPDDRERVMGIHMKRLKGEEVPPVYEFRAIHKQGNTMWLENNGILIEWDGRPASLNFVRDITGRKKAEEELKESEKRYRLLVESASDSIFLLAMEGSFIDANPAACDSLGRTREELLTLSVSDIDPDWPSEKLKNFLRELITGKPETIEGTYCRKNKTSFPVEIRLTKVDVDERQVVLALARDITQRRRIEESLRRKAEIVSQEDKAHVSGIDIEWDHENGICTFEKLPVLMMWRDTTLAALMSGVQTMVGAERFGLALQAEGRKSVEDDWRVISQFPDFNKGFEAIANIGAVAGWGDWKLIELDTENKECVFRILNSWEGLYQKALGVNWGSGMLAGKLAGYCSMLFKDNCWADQTAFVAKGDDFDEFRVHTSERSVEKEIENLLATDKATRADMAVALQNLRTEIAMRQGVEQALRESEQHYRAIVEDQTELICRNLSDGTITFVNEAYCRYFVKNRDELIGQKFMPLIPEEDHEKVKEHFASVGPDNPVVTYEHRAVMPNGEIRWHQWTNRAILDDTGKVIEYQGVGRDITKQKLAEEELKENEKRFRSLSEAAFEGIAITEKGVMVDANDALLRMYGYSLEELRGKQVIDLVAPEDRELVQQRIHSGYEGVYEHKGIRKDGSLIDLEVQGRNVEYLGWTMRLTAIRDITERKQAERRIQEYQAQLKSLASELLLAEERERRRIATGIHDDIAQKLAMAKFSLQTLQASIKDADVSVSLEKQCELMSQIVADARSLTFELGNPVLYQVGLEAAVESYLTERIQEEFGIECKFLSEGPLSSLDEDIKVVLFQSVRELLANVVKHANASTIEVDVLNAEDKLRIVVKDDGVGFDPTEIGPHAMGRGGFGLFNIRERLEFFGGNLEIESRPESGTRVTMTVAVRTDAVAE